MSAWTLKSIPPHDWFICLDIDSYFDHEHEPEKILEEGFTRPLSLDDKDIIATVFYNGDPENPEFNVETNEPLSKNKIEQANKVLARILGTNIDLRPFYDQAENDSVLGPKLNEFYGLKRMARGNLLEDIINRIVQMRLSHKPTAKKNGLQSPGCVWHTPVSQWEKYSCMAATISAGKGESGSNQEAWSNSKKGRIYSGAGTGYAGRNS